MRQPWRAPSAMSGMKQRSTDVVCCGAVLSQEKPEAMPAGFLLLQINTSHQLTRRKGLCWLIVLEVSVHCLWVCGFWVCEESTTQGRGSDSHQEIWGKGGGRSWRKENRILQVPSRTHKSLQWPKDSQPHLLKVPTPSLQYMAHWGTFQNWTIAEAKTYRKGGRQGKGKERGKRGEG